MKMQSILELVLDRWPIKVLCLAIAIVLYILFRVNTLTERTLTIPLEVITPEGFVVSSEYARSVNVTLRGEEDDIGGILPEDVEAFVNLSPYPEEGEFTLAVELQKTGTALKPEALELRPRPREITLSQERRTVRSLIVRPELSGFPALGFELTQFFVSPSSVTAVGPRSQMSDLEELRTEIIDLSGRMDDFTVTTRLVRPSDQIAIPGGEVVEFRGVIDEAVVIRTITDREVVILDLPANLKIAGILPKVSLTVQGSQLNVEGARPQEMTFYIDGSQISGPGNYTLPLKMDIPPGLAVLQLLPREITFTVERSTGNSAAPPAAPGPPPQDTQAPAPFGSSELPPFSSIPGAAS